MQVSKGLVLNCFVSYFKLVSVMNFVATLYVGGKRWRKNFISNPKNSGDDILHIMQIWCQYIANNEEEEITNNDNEMIWNILYDVACRLSNTFSTFGKRFLKKIEKETSGK